MPAKLRKSRSGNVTKSNNRPASKQSRKRKTPKNNVSKGKAKKTTRRRSKRGGASASDINTELDKFVAKVMVKFAEHFKMDYYHINGEAEAQRPKIGMPNLDFKRTLFSYVWKDTTNVNSYTEMRNLKDRLSSYWNWLDSAFYYYYEKLEDGSSLKRKLSKETHRGAELDYNELNRLINDNYEFNPQFQSSQGYTPLENQVLDHYSN